MAIIWTSNSFIREGTAKIGDPSGSTINRKMIDDLILLQNVNLIKLDLNNILENFKNFICNKDDYTCNFQLLPAKIYNNMDWYKSINVINYLSDVGRYFRMGTMLRKNFIKNRISSIEDKGLTFNEFTYQIFQAYDWYHLYCKENCVFQLGGSDQMGNMEAGYEYIKKRTSDTVHCITMPLLKSRKGEKMSKSLGNVIWLNADKTSPYDFYQHLIRLPDDELETYLKYFTFFSLERIEDILTFSKSKPDLKHGQMELAKHLTLLIHGPKSVEMCEKCSEILFSCQSSDLTPRIFDSSFWLEDGVRDKKNGIEDENALDATQNISELRSSDTGKVTVSTVLKTLGIDLSIRITAGGNRDRHVEPYNTQSGNKCQHSPLNNEGEGKRVMQLTDHELKSLTIGHLLRCCIRPEIFKNENDMLDKWANKAIKINGLNLESFDQPFCRDSMVYEISDTKSITVLKIGKRNFRLIQWLHFPKSHKTTYDGIDIDETDSANTTHRIN
ncbi:tyrosine--tRNA ligase, mitochondrial-like isoform X2 [Gordionus sp. m RMFG-2023]|uniref:tyrosine--tRNA ligase, mitochondrial-like isoform X2 n=1 Tax=Gordionus sp. m RMFG-2023 TaxID=3053472 RepID=UPI0031FCD1D4